MIGKLPTLWLHRGAVPGWATTAAAIGRGTRQAAGAREGLLHGVDRRNFTHNQIICKLILYSLTASCG